MTTQRVQLVLSSTDGAQVIALKKFTDVRIERDLRDLAGTFSCTVFDVAREFAAGNVQQSGSRPGNPAVMIEQGMQATINLDGTPVLVGRVDAVDLTGDAETDTMTISGRDRTCNLVDCAAAPNGPTEYRNMDLLQIATLICAPYGITPVAQTDIGAKFVLASLNPHDTAHAFLEGLARQRSTLLVSDGVGGLLLTSGGTSRAPADLTRGVNILRYQIKRDWAKRFSDYYVKGQTNSAGYTESTDAPITHATMPGVEATNTGVLKPTILMTGHAQDPEITEYRPTVRLTRSQSGMSSTQDQASWALRVAKGEADQIVYTVQDWRAGAPAPAGSAAQNPTGQAGLGALWLPNQLVAVNDPLGDLDDDYLIAGVTWTYGKDGTLSELRVVGRTAYDQIDLAAKRRPHGKTNKGQVLQSDFNTLFAP